MKNEIPVSNPGLDELYPLIIGSEVCSKNHSYGPATRDYYLIHYILEGKGIFQFGKKIYQLSKGQCFLICPKDITFYKADAEFPWHYIWIAFSGEKAELLLKRAGLSAENPIFSGAGITAIFENLNIEIQSEYIKNTNLSYYLLSKIYELLHHLSISEPKGNLIDQYIDKVKNYVTALYSQDISIERLALFCNLDRRYLCRIFKAKTGLTLQQYLLKTRLEKAYTLVVTTELSISDISRSVGYRDLYNFSRMFKKQYGKSPLILRQTC